jgi:heptosyltransferase-3
MSSTASLPPEGVRRILVIKYRSPGDVVLMTPMLSALKRAFPQAEIVVALNAESAPLVELHPAVSGVLPYDRAARERSPLRRLRQEAALLKGARGFDIVINATEGDRGALLALASGAPVRVGLKAEKPGLAFKERIYTHLLPPWPRERHNVMCNLDLVALLGIDTSGCAAEVALAGEDAARVEECLAAGGVEPGQSVVQVHAPSRATYKQWTPEGVAAVVDHLDLERGLRVILTGAPEEAPYVARIAALCRSRPIDLAGRLTLRQVAALARRACLFFGVDTVAMHLAAAVNTPVVALFGPTRASSWGPWDNGGPADQYAIRAGVQVSGPHVIIASERDCVPCGDMGCRHGGRSACLDELEPGEVITVIDGVLDRVAQPPRAGSAPTSA